PLFRKSGRAECAVATRHKRSATLDWKKWSVLSGGAAWNETATSPCSRKQRHGDLWCAAVRTMAAVCHHGFVHPVHCGLKGVKGRLHSGMYLQYFGLKDDPFSVTPDPAFLFLGTPHREALGHLLYGAGEHGGFVQLSGEVGTGKTTLIRALLENRVPELDIALCWHPQLHVREFMATICDELGVAYDPNRDVSLKALVDRLHTHLLHNHATGRRTSLIIDEVQNLDRDVLEQLRLLTNLETSKHKLLRIILVGQSEMDTCLARHDLRQLSQRISARFRLTALNRCETVDYINHRLACVG